MNNSRNSCECSRRDRKRNNERRARKLQQALIQNQMYKGIFNAFCGDDICADSDNSSDECSVELPWHDLIITDTDLPRIKPKVKIDEKVEEREFELEKKVSSGLMHLPWEDITLTRTVQSEEAKKEMNRCDSWLEIPWDEILFDSNLKIAESDEELKKCPENDIEIPWNDLLIPENIILYPKLRYGEKRPKRHCGCSRTKH